MIVALLKGRSAKCNCVYSEASPEIARLHRRRGRAGSVSLLRKFWIHAYGLKKRCTTAVPRMVYFLVVEQIRGWLKDLNITKGDEDWEEVFFL